MVNFLFKILFSLFLFYSFGNFDLFSAFCENSEIISETEITQNPQKTTTQETANPYYIYFGLFLFLSIVLITKGFQAGPDNLTEALQHAAVNALMDFQADVADFYIYGIPGNPEE